MANSVNHDQMATSLAVWSGLFLSICQIFRENKVLLKYLVNNKVM